MVGFRSGGGYFGGGGFYRKSGLGSSGAASSSKHPSSKQQDGDDNNNARRKAAAASTRFFTSDSSPLTTPADKYENGYLNLPPSVRCPSALFALERLVAEDGPDHFSLHNLFKYVADCPNMPPSVAEIGISIRRKEDRLRKRAESGKVNHQT